MTLVLWQNSNKNSFRQNPRMKFKFGAVSRVCKDLNIDKIKLSYFVESYF